MKISPGFRQFFLNNIFPAHVFLLLVFFLTHGYVEHSDILNVKDLIPLFFYLLLLSLILYWLSIRLFQNRSKAGLFTTFVLIVILFYGAIENFFGSFRALADVAVLRYILPVLIVLLAICFWLIKKVKIIPTRLGYFFTILFSVYIIIDVFTAVFDVSTKETATAQKVSGEINLRSCDSCKKPDLYLIVLDEYFGTQGLKQYYNYDNSQFEGELIKQDFNSVKGAVCNYPHTNLSVASLLNMKYFSEPERKSFYEGFKGLKKSLNAIKNNIVCKYLESQGYRINNYSIFHIGNHPPLYYNSFIPVGNNVITEKTLFHRLEKALPVLLPDKLKFGWLKGWLDNGIDRSNKKVLKQTLAGAEKIKERPNFYYLHLTMPHLPYLYDSLGNRMHLTYEMTDRNLLKLDSAYLQYLVYTNHHIIEFIKELKKKTRGQDIIVLMGDHGFRPASRKGEHQLKYMVLNAIYLPDQNYTGFYDGMSNVNLFRVLFNTQFAQKLPLLKDSLFK